MAASERRWAEAAAATENRRAQELAEAQARLTRDREAFLRQLEEHFATRRFTNTADAFDTVKAYVIEHVANR